MQPAGDRAQEEFAASPIPTIVWRRSTRDFIFHAVNRAASIIAGELANQLVGVRASDMYRDRPDMIEMMERAWNDQVPIQHHLPVRALVEGRERIFRIDVAPLPPDRLVMHAIDITAQSAAEENLRVSAHRLKLVFEDASVAIVRLDDLGSVVEANPAAYTLLGFAPTELIGASLGALSAQDDPSSAGQASVSEREFRRPDGTRLNLEVSASPATGGGRMLFLRDITERVGQQDALRRSEERYRRLFEQSVELIYRIDPAGILVDLNPAVLRATGWAPNEILGRHFTDIIHPEDRPVAIAKFESALSGVTMRREFRVLMKNGGHLFLDAVSNPELVDGRIVGVFGTGHDVTEARIAMKQLEEREHLISAVLDRLPIGVVVTDTRGNILRSNPAGDEIWGFHRTQTALKSPESYHAWWADTHRPVSTEEWASTAALRSGKPVLNQLIEIEAADGAHKFILNSAVPLFAEDGTVQGTVVLNQDVTALRMEQEQREQVDAHLREIIASTSDGICTIDAEGRATLVSPAAARMLGSTPDALVGSGLNAILHGGETEDDAFAEVMRTGEARPLYKDVFTTRAGSTFDVEVSCAPIEIGGAVQGAVVTFRDVTRRKLLERDLERAERMSAIGQLAATVAHEFNNVLMGISPFMEVIERRAQGDGELRALTSHIQQSLQRGKQITREILKFAQAPDPELRGLRLRPVLEAALPELNAIAGRRMTVRLECRSDDVAACIDPTQVHQSLSNLVANARDAMNSEGTISIEAAMPGPEETRHLPPGDWVKIAVSDEGSGIAPSILERIFEPLYTTKQAGGTGLGLAVVQQVVSKHGGFVEVDSTVGTGTTFRLYFPRCDPPEDDQAVPAEAVSRAASRLLLVEDDQAVAAGLQMVLEMEGITTQVIGRGGDAEDAVERFNPDAVVLDRGLPDMDGLEVARRLLQRWPRLPLIFSTGHGDREDIEEMGRGRKIAYLLKPYSVETLLETLDELLQS